MRKLKTKIGDVYFEKESNGFCLYDSDKRYLGFTHTKPTNKITHVADLVDLELFNFMSYAQSENELFEEVNNFLIEEDEEPFNNVDDIKNTTYCFGVYGRVGNSYFFADYI